MNKAYLLVICVLAASFTGCLSDDTSDLEEQQNTEDETIEPVGTDNNETQEYWYDELIAEVNSLKSQIDNMTHNPLENSTVIMYRGNNEYINFTKTGNTIQINHTHGLGNNMWFEDNNGVVIERGPVNEIADRCNHNGTWYSITNQSACGGSTDGVVYEINLVREPLTVSYGVPFSYFRTESFP